MMFPLAHEWLVRLGLACVGGTLSILLAGAVCRFLPRLPATTRCWLWWLACLKLLVGVAFLPTIALPLPRGVALPTPFQTPLAHVPASTQTPERQAEATAPHPLPQEESTEGRSVALGPTLGESCLSFLLGGWLVGVGVGLGMQGMALLQLRRLTRAAVFEENAALTAAAQRVGLQRVPLLGVSRSPIEPLTLAGGGARRPVILVSQDDFSRLSFDELLSLLTHECVHIRRGDLYFSLVPWLAQTLFWFFPPVYLALREFELAREAVCDQQTVALLTLAPRTYGELLVKLSSPASPLSTPSSVMGLSAGFHQLKRRIEMLNFPAVPPPTRAGLLVVFIAVLGILAPLRLTTARAADPQPTAAASGAAINDLPNLDLAQGLKFWHKTALGSDTEPHPFFEVGVDPAVLYENRPSGYVRAKQTTEVDPPGDGGVFRYDVADRDLARYTGKRVRLSAFVRGKEMTNKAFLFLALGTGTQLNFGTSPEIKPASSATWERVACVVDIPEKIQYLMLGLRLEGKGVVYGNGFRLEVVDKSVPLTALRVVEQSDQESPESELHNLDFRQGLGDWWNDNPQHTATDDYALTFEPKGGRNNGPAICLQSSVSKPRLYGTVAQNAKPGNYLSKRVRFHAYLKTKDADKVALWLLVLDQSGTMSSGFNGDSTGKILRGTQGWTKIEYTMTIPATTTGLSFGISSEGKGKVWVDGFHFEVVEPAPK